MERCGVDGGARGAGLAAFPDGGIRAARGIVAPEKFGRRPVADLSRTRGRADYLRKAAGLHAYRADADYGASVRRVLGISDGRILRGDAAIRNSGRFYVFRGLLPSRRYRSFSGLDAGAFSTGLAWAEVFLWHAS